MIFLKDKATDLPLGSDLDKTSFVLCIQTPFQLDAFRHLGNGFIRIDATHNTTQYPDFLLFTIIARDRWGHGMSSCILDFGSVHSYPKIGIPVAWMLSSNGTTETISYFLNWVKEASPAVRPAVIMTDRDQAQINTIMRVYPDSQTLLCLWHVLCAFRSHFVTDQFQALWARVKSWVRTEDSDEFDWIWAEISADPTIPQSFMDYLDKDWMAKDHMWSLSKWTEHSLLEEGNTNMLIEVYVI
jgi:MULE transposase domain